MRNALTRRSILGTALCLSICACESGPISDLLHRRGRTTVVLIDGSGSIPEEDRAIYVASIRAIADTLQAGDRLLVGEIGADDRGAFRAKFDLTVPDSEVRLDREEAVAAARAQVNRAVPTLVPEGDRPGARSTLILAAIAAASQAFGTEPRNGDRLVLLTDGVEEGPVVNLVRLTTDPTAISAAIDRARRAGLLPALNGVEMTVAGAGGDNYVAVEQFWRVYASTTHATLANYGRLAFRPTG